MLDRLPVFLDPLSFSDRRKSLSGTIEICEFSRLSDLLLDVSGVVEVNVSFDKEGRLPVILGSIKANLILECQACLGKINWQIDRSFKLGLVTSLEQADSLTSDCEPLILENKKISLNEIIEDELLLALPDFPRHQNECVIRECALISTGNDEEQLNSNNPFSVLAKLKNTGD